ncbi:MULTISPECIES: sensor histidine kinase [Kitasatospora]|uniref:histidine kinase n=1 Tax=Kitasatospora indigofera TaxID=67307 RepID=A0A919KLC4_9ACTN|nr:MULTISPECIES: HAMP domain-containing sensor histidine kinase [Kitasatospora]MDQ0310568.1 signal transduction histidine kinase [Kitasatospora herbaricolor]GGV08172.1 two-component sensor histidine kinase [Kitasatospora herbaricolor]GHH61865.1 two-component sensor histidine kinase [Kitasatospora indigofera]
MTFPQQRNGDTDTTRPPTLAARAARRVWADIRPLDPVRSIKGKLALLVIVSVFLASGMVVVAIRSETQIRIIMIFSMIASLLFMQFLAHGLTAPLRDMTLAAREMAGGDYSRRVEVSSRDEIGELAATFNQMAADLEAADRHRRELVANVSHELRTPIAALRAVLENVVDGVVQPNPATLGAALEQTERLGRLVTHLLDLSKLDGGVVPLDARPFEVRTFLDGVLRGVTVDGATAGGAFSRRGDVRLALEVRPSGLTGVADPERLHQVVANLVDNACKHSPPGGTVTVRARPSADPGGLLLEVEDEGPGIPLQDRSRVFERFSRSGAATAQGPGSDGGTGLGLAIARWAVDLHGGQIEVAEAARGCRIEVRLPGQR